MKELFFGHYYLFLAAYLAVITALLLAVVKIFRRRWVGNARVRPAAMNLSILLFSILYTLLVLEGISAYLLVQSDGFGFTLASKEWFHRHWNPINSYGYRDHEPEWSDKIAFVVGDSFVAGHGIENINDRFSNILSRKLGKTWTVTMLAKNGWNTGDYLAAVRNHDKKPRVLIVSYSLNDIEAAASEKGVMRPKLREYPSGIIAPLVDHSYFLNWLYWRVFRSRLGSDTYWNHLKQAYSNDGVWAAHLQGLDSLIDFGHRVGAKIGFVVWPNLADVTGSKMLTSRVLEYLRNRSVIALDLSEHFDKVKTHELTVNSMDAHPNEVVHAEVARLLYTALAPWN